MVKRFVRALLMGGVIALFTTAPQVAQAAEQDGTSNSNREQKSIVGSWGGTLDDGARTALLSFGADGIALSSLQGEVSVTQPALTLEHGVWTRLGGRQFAFTLASILYDTQTGAYQGAVKLRAVLTLARSGDALSGSAKADVFAPDGNLVVTIPHTFHFTRIKVEPFD